MKKYILLAVGLLFAMNVDAQRLFEDEAEDAKGFMLNIVFKYKDSEPVTVTIMDNYDPNSTNSDTYGADIKFRNTGCDFEVGWKIPIVGRFSYDQLRQYLVDIDIRTFQPQDNAHDVSADLQIKFMYLPTNQKNYNTFHWNYNPNNIGDENQILTYLLEVFNDNVFIPCAKEFVEKLETYIEE